MPRCERCWVRPCHCRHGLGPLPSPNPVRTPETSRTESGRASWPAALIHVTHIVRFLGGLRDARRRTKARYRSRQERPVVEIDTRACSSRAGMVSVRRVRNGVLTWVLGVFRIMYKRKRCCRCGWTLDTTWQWQVDDLTGTVSLRQLRIPQAYASYPGAPRESQERSSRTE